MKGETMRRKKCNEYERAGAGKTGDEDFQKHAEGCEECRKNAAEDEKIMAAARELGRRGRIEAPGLWERIEKDLVKLGSSRRFGRSWILKPVLLAPITAGLLLALGGGLYFTLHPRWTGISSGLLAHDALVKVEKAEAQYLRAIEDLEKKALPQTSRMDLELRFLYKDRLATIDAQIEHCREALETNPANAHIRRYMMAALQDKKETLSELLRTENKPAGKALTKKMI
jgi:hypothetical protein